MRLSILGESMRCHLCKAELPQQFKPNMVCAMCVRFGRARNTTLGRDDLATWRRQAETKRTEDTYAK